MDIIDRLIERLDRKIRQAHEEKPFDDRCQGSFTFGNCIVTFFASNKGNDVEIWNPTRDTYLDCIAEHIAHASVPFADVKTDKGSIWNDNGFRDEADYLMYKFG